MRINDLFNETIEIMSLLVEYTRQVSPQQIREQYEDYLADPDAWVQIIGAEMEIPGFDRFAKVLEFIQDYYDAEKPAGKSVDDFFAAINDATITDLEAWLADAPEEPYSMAEQAAWLKSDPSNDNFINELKDIIVDPTKLDEQREIWDQVPDSSDQTIPDRIDESTPGSPEWNALNEAEAGLAPERGSGAAAVGEHPRISRRQFGGAMGEHPLEEVPPTSEAGQLIGALDDDTLAVIREKFTAAAFFGQNLEKFNVETPKGVMNVLEWLSLPENEGMSDDEVLGWIQATQWFDLNAPTARTFDMDFWAEGPEGRDALIDSQRDLILREAQLIGLGWLGDNQALLDDLATTATRFGYDVYDIRSALQGVNDLGPEELARGMILSNEQSVQDMAAKYYMPLRTEDAYDIAWSIYKGEESLDSVEAMYREQAKGAFPSLAGLIDQGVSMRAYFSPYKQRIGQLLELSDVDLMNDPRFQPILSPGPGEGPMSLSQTQTFVRNLPEWQFTQNARNSARRMVDNVGRMFGMVA
jgi:hypothetical protein